MKRTLSNLQNHVRHHCAWQVAVHADLSDETAAQFFINPCTVVGMVIEAQVPEGGWFLQAAATSVLGRQVCPPPAWCPFNEGRRHEHMYEGACASLTPQYSTTHIGCFTGS